MWGEIKKLRAFTFNFITCVFLISTAKLKVKVSLIKEALVSLYASMCTYFGEEVPNCSSSTDSGCVGHLFYGQLKLRKRQFTRLQQSKCCNKNMLTTQSFPTLPSLQN